MKWVDNTLVTKDGSLFTVKGKILEIRGSGWEGKKHKGDTPQTDRPRICKFDNSEQAIRVAELIAIGIENE